MFTPFKVGCLFGVKDLIPRGLRSRVVYRFSCAGCNACYGLTNRHFATGIREHLSPDKNSLWVRNCHYLALEACFKILDSASIRYQLKIREAMHIFWEQLFLNICNWENRLNLSLSYCMCTFIVNVSFAFSFHIFLYFYAVHISYHWISSHFVRLLIVTYKLVSGIVSNWLFHPKHVLPFKNNVTVLHQKLWTKLAERTRHRVVHQDFMLPGLRSRSQAMMLPSTATKLH